jgi:tetratricopeptide (TPR) repeat protein
MLRAALVSVIAAACVATLRAPAMSSYLGRQSYEDVYYLPSPEWLRRFALGHDEALSDLVWMKGLVYIGDEFAHRGDVENVYRYADAILALDPDFRRAYSWAATMGLYRPTAPTLEEGLGAVRYLERGVERFPDDGELVWELAAAYSYELPSLTRDVAEKERFRTIGSEHMLAAARMGAGPKWLALTNASHLETLGRLDQAIRHLEEMYAVVQDEDTREQIALRLESLRAGANAEALRSAERDLLERAKRDFPWIPPDFYVLVGERRIPRVD